MQNIHTVRRVVRAPGARLLAFRGEHWIDLEAWLRARGAPAGMRERLGAGWFSLARLGDALDDPKAQRVEPVALDGSAPLLPPLLASEARQILALGKNFRAHAAEFGEEVPEEPLVFAKLPGALVGSGETVTVPSWYTARYDFESELAVLIGRAGSDVDEEHALELVAGYTVANDLTARSMQGRARKQGHPWLEAKNLGRALPLGPCFVPAGALDETALTVSAKVNGESKQEASTADLVVSIPAALARFIAKKCLRSRSMS